MRWPAKIVLVCLVAGLFETGVVVATLHTAAALIVTHAGVVTSAVCAVAGLIGLFQRPRTIGTAICGLGVAVGILGLGLTLFIELIVRVFSTVSL